MLSSSEINVFSQALVARPDADGTAHGVRAHFQMN